MADDTRTPPNPLTALILRRMEALGWDQQKHLLDALREQGLHLDKSTVSYWFSGGGIHDRHRPKVAKALGVSLGQLQEAASERDRLRAEGNDERAVA